MKISAFIDKNLKFFFLLPAILLLLLLLGFPIISSLYYSFTDKSLIYPGAHFTGVENYISILKDKAFLNAFFNSIRFTIYIVVAQLIVGMTAALAQNHIRRFKGLFRMLLIIPWTFPSIVIAFTWNWLFNDLYGPISTTLIALGFIDKPLLFLASPQLAVFSIVLVTTWFGFPFMMVSILAGLQSIDKSEYEAAYIDGANALKSFLYITLPHLKVIIGLIVSLRIIWVFNNLDLILLLTGGGPGNTTETLPLYIYRTGWGLNSLGKAAATAVILVIFLMIGIMLYFKLLNKREGENRI